MWGGWLGDILTGRNSVQLLVMSTYIAKMSRKDDPALQKLSKHVYVWDKPHSRLGLQVEILHGNTICFNFSFQSVEFTDNNSS